MAKTTLQDVQGIKDPMLSDNFGFQVSNVPGSGNDRPLTIQCKSVVKPGMQLEEVEYALFGHVVKHAGRLTTSHEFTAEFYETFDGSITRTVESWLEWARAKSSQHGHFKNGTDGYAKDATLTIYDQTGNASLTYKLFGVWPSASQDLSFDGSSANGLTQSITFKFDSFELIQGA
jgi:T4-like virus tail tube protein gp19